MDGELQAVSLTAEPPLPQQPSPSARIIALLCERELAAAIPYAEAIARDSFARMRKAFTESGIEVPSI